MNQSTNSRTPGIELAKFMEWRGRRIVEACGVLWHSLEGRFFMSLPYQTPVDPDRGQLDRMLRSARALGARFPSRTWQGLSSGIYMYRGKTLTLQQVHPKHRPRVRKGFEKFVVRWMEADELEAKGFQLNIDTMNRQGRYDPEFGELGNWKRLTKAVGRSCAVKAVGAFHDERLSAYMITCREDGCLHILHQMSRTEDLNDFPNHLLTYAVTKQGAEDPQLDSVCYGSVSLVQTDGLHEYKLRFGYEVLAHSSAFRLHPGFAPFLANGGTVGLVRILRVVFPNDQRLERTDAVLRGARMSRKVDETHGLAKYASESKAALNGHIEVR